MLVHGTEDNSGRATEEGKKKRKKERGKKK